MESGGDDSCKEERHEIGSRFWVPKKLLVVGGGVIGMEYATIFKALDIEVTILESNDYILSFVDREIVEEFIHHLRDCNISLRFADELKSIETRDRWKGTASIP